MSITAPRTAATCALTLALLAATPARAGEAYVSGGFPGLMLGYSHSLTPQFGLRGDIGGLPTTTRNVNEEGIDYKAKGRAFRTGLFGDWYPLSGTFRVTTGLTFNDMKLDLAAEGSGNPITIGSQTFTFTQGDRFDVRIKFPSTTPYFGVGWGHNAAERGFNFLFDIGASFGKAKVTATTNRNDVVTQQDIDNELQELRDGVGKLRFIPQITLGLGYRF
jgi:hypothetical protein